MKQLVILNFEMGKVIIIPISRKIEEAYKDEFEEYIFGELNYSPNQVQYMVVKSENDIYHL